jgi:hypothetical protein
MYSLSKDVNVNLTVSTPHHYLLQIFANWRDRFKDTSLHLNHFRIQADLECDEATSVYPTTFHAYMIFLNMISVHYSVMTTNVKAPVMLGQIDFIARIFKNVYGGVKLIYDDKAKAVTLQ